MGRRVLTAGCLRPQPWKSSAGQPTIRIMTTIDIESLSPQERLDLIGQLWDSLDTNDVQLTPAQTAELERRLETLDEDIQDGGEAGDVLAELRRRYP